MPLSPERQQASLKVPFELYNQRRQRMKRLIELDAPPTIIRAEAKLLLRSFKPLTLKALYWKYMPNWVHMLNPSYRRMSRKLDEEMDRLFDEDEAELGNEKGV